MSEFEKLRDALADPDTVHVNMLQGAIAKPSVEQILHVYAGQLSDASTLSALQEQNRAMREVCKILSSAKTAAMAGLAPRIAIDRMTCEATEKAEAILAALAQKERQADE